MLVFLAHAASAAASVSLLLEEPFGKFGAWNPTGHTAIYLDRVCSDSFTDLRRCRAGEMGVVISRYHKVHHDDWIAMPLVPYLYSVNTLAEVPQTIDHTGKKQYRDAYWAQHFSELILPASDGSAPGGNWTQLVGSSFDRSSYVYRVSTTPEQDDALIAYLNQRSDKSHFNLFFNNCANFAAEVLNYYFPDSFHRNAIADFDLMTPKQVARDMVKLGRKHPELQLQTFILPQLPGTAHRSHRVDGIAESLVKTKRWLLPLLVLQPEIPAYSLVAYLTAGRLRLPENPAPLPEVSSVAPAPAPPRH